MDWSKYDKPAAREADLSTPWYEETGLVAAVIFFVTLAAGVAVVAWLQ